ncbi:MAG: NF038122 family metalloprotease, partial [Waterburya sp.]
MSIKTKKETENKIIREWNEMETGVDFNFTYAPGITEEQILGFELAGEFWSQHLTDDISINLFVEMADYLPENVIGGALPAIETNVKYEDYRSNLEQDITSNIDSLVNSNQQDETDKFTAYFTSQYEDDGYKVDNNEYIKMTRANAKALDLVSAQDNELDGYIVMRDLNGVEDGNLNNIRWNYDYQSSVV